MRPGGLRFCGSQNHTSPKPRRARFISSKPKRSFEDYSILGDRSAAGEMFTEVGKELFRGCVRVLVRGSWPRHQFLLMRISAT